MNININVLTRPGGKPTICQRMIRAGFLFWLMRKSNAQFDQIYLGAISFMDASHVRRLAREYLERE